MTGRCAYRERRCVQLGTEHDELQWSGWRRWTAWLLWFAWHDDRARLGLASDCLPEPHEGEIRAPSRADFRAYACAVLAQRHLDELAQRWSPSWNWWLNASAATWSDNLQLANRCAEWIYRRKVSEVPNWAAFFRWGNVYPLLDPPLVERAASGDEIAARVLGWLNDACLRAIREHAC